LPIALNSTSDKFTNKKASLVITEAWHYICCTAVKRIMFYL